MKFRWTLAPPQPALATHLAIQLKLSPLLAQCLLNRGHSELALAEDFLSPRLKNLADPFLLPNMERAVERLLRAREHAERVVIFGDYDVDGVTSTALLLEVFRALGWQADFYLPHRLEEGYGLSQDGVENCLAKFQTRLLLAVDCGSTATATIAWLRERGVEVLVLDHHQVSDPPPPAVALVNPQLAPADAPSYRELCSVGLAFKLAHALLKRLREQEVGEASDFDLRPFLDLVALGTVADLVPLVGENRILVSAGLERLSVTQRPGLKALKIVAQVKDPIGVYEIGFQLAPRLNAAGRLETAAQALHLLLARDLHEAETIAVELDARNRERQQIERTMADEVIGAVRARFNPETDFAIVEGQLLWHIGVVGIVASRVLREFYRPTIIIGGDGDEWRGSGRSIEGFDLAAALRQCDDLLVRHGGHAMAAGLSIAPGNLDGFRERLNELAQRSLTPEMLRPVLRLDAEVALPELTLAELAHLNQLKPTGQGNPVVNLMARSLTMKRPPQRIGKEGRHAKFQVTDGSTELEAVWWSVNDSPLPGGRFDLAFEPQLNEYNGRRMVQLKVLDWRPAQ
ncbi:MAG: single-stranded-DNA-specific exonuclease RecJ [Verrucomicrobia bacterium]|nr:single-stranded-DNA-specific exonuclease RecJ [Verrucomicrobiota bacterium]